MCHYSLRVCLSNNLVICESSAKSLLVLVLLLILVLVLILLRLGVLQHMPLDDGSSGILQDLCELKFKVSYAMAWNFYKLSSKSRKMY